MRTFHIGGAAQRGAEQSSVEAPIDGTVAVRNRNVVADSEGVNIVMGRNLEVVLSDEAGRERAHHRIPYGAKLLVDEGGKVEKGDRLAEWDPYTIPIITEKEGIATYVDLTEGVSMRETMDETTGISNRVVVDWKQIAHAADLRPRITLRDEKNNVVTLANGLEARYFMSVDAILSVENGARVKAGDVLARIPRETSKTRDITGGLPRVAELFEARKPKDFAIISEIAGRVEFGKDYKTKRRIVVVPEDESLEPSEYLLPKGKHISVQEGDYVERGDLLMDGNPVPHDILEIMGIEALAEYLIYEIQSVYRLQGVKINDKHIEVIVRQMLQKVEITDGADTTFPGRRAGRPRGVRGGQREDPGRRRPAGPGQAGPAGHHQGQPADPLLYLRGLLPGDHAGPDRGGGQRQDRQPDRSQGERDRRPPDPGGHGLDHEPGQPDRRDPGPGDRRRTREGGARRPGRIGAGRGAVLGRLDRDRPGPKRSGPSISTGSIRQSRIASRFYGVARSCA